MQEELVGYGKPWKQQYNFNLYKNNNLNEVTINNSTKLPFNVFKSSIAILNNNIILIGGTVFDKVSSSVFIINMSENSKVSESYTTGCSLPEPLVEHDVILKDKVIYTIGGFNGKEYTTKIYGNELDEDGNLTTWKLKGTLPKAIKGVKSFVYKDYIYVFGSQVEYSRFNVYFKGRIDKNKKITDWVMITIAANSYNEEYNLRDFGYGDIAIIKNMVYLIGIVDPNNPAKMGTLRGIILDNGDIDQWDLFDDVGEKLINPNTIVTNNRLYIISNIHEKKDDKVENVETVLISSIIYEDGSLGRFNYENITDVSPSDNLNVFLIKDNVFLFGFNELVTRDQDNICSRIRLKADHSNYIEFK